GTGGVLLEVVSLIRRLESDRQEAKEALQEERHKAQRLKGKQDSLSLWKQQQFPVAVQLEYEACSRDITELRWHLKINNGRMQQVRGMLKQAERKNRQLLENIDFVKKQVPLVKEKLCLENRNTKQIESARSEVSEVLRKLTHELSKSQQELENDELQMNNERDSMTQALKNIRTQLKEQITELQQLKASWDVSSAIICETEEKSALKDKQVEAMLQQIPTLETQETELSNSELLHLRDKNKEHELEAEDYNKKICQRAQVNFPTLKRKHCTKTQYHYTTPCTVQQITCALQLSLYCKHCPAKTIQKMCKKAVQQLQKDQKRILEKISENEEQRDQAKGELALHNTRHTNTKAQLEDLEHQTLVQEQSMRKETEMMKLQLISEMKLVAALKEYEVTEADFERKTDEVVKEHEEASTTFAQLETEMVKLREIHTAKSKEVEDLNRKLSDVLTAHKTLSDDLEQQKHACLDRLRSANEAHKTVLVRCEHVSRRLKELRLKCEEYRKQSEEMEDALTAMPQILKELQSESDNMEYKHNLISTVMSSLQSDTVACRNRTDLSKEAHSSLLVQRQAAMQDLKTNLRKALKENSELAQEYRELQKSTMVAKREAAFTLSEKNRAEASLHNRTQLSLLQRRMHKAMLKYFKHRSIYSQAELAHFQALSNQNKQKMKALQ
ncbi:coiled-coil domain-containing protein 178 isoform X3, partial [Silurus meridionalis]